jgi:hypothetical protein
MAFSGKDSMSTYQSLNYKCACGAVKIQIKSLPLTRLFCHCTICQNASNRDYADDILVLAKDVIIGNTTSIIYKQHTNIFPLQRGQCKHCHSPVVAFSSLLPFVKIAVIPTCFYSSQVNLPDPVAHVFYSNSRIHTDDSLPKYNTYISSQIMTVKYILCSIIKRFTS